MSVTVVGSDDELLPSSELDEGEELENQLEEVEGGALSELDEDWEDSDGLDDEDGADDEEAGSDDDDEDDENGS